MIKLLEHCLYVPIIKEIIFLPRIDMLNNNVYYFIIIKKMIITKHVEDKHSVYDNNKKTYKSKYTI
jgi:hypothetical protein